MHCKGQLSLPGEEFMNQTQTKKKTEFSIHPDTRCHPIARGLRPVWHVPPPDRESRRVEDRTRRRHASSDDTR